MEIEGVVYLIKPHWSLIIHRSMDISMPGVMHNTLCVISTEIGHCVTQHSSIHNDGAVAFNGEMYVSLLRYG